MTRSFAPVLVVAAAFVFGGAVVLGFPALTGGVVRVLVAVAVAGVGAGVALLPGGALVERAVGTGLVAFGAGLLGSMFSADLLRYGVPALVVLALAVTGMRVWISGAGVLLALVLPDGALVAVAAGLAVVVVFAPARAWWGDLLGAVAGTAVVLEPVAVIAVVLLMTAAARRDLVTGLLAATVLVVPDIGHVWPLLVIVLVALVAVRVPRVRDLVTRIPALRDTRPAHATAGAAVVAASGFVGIAIQLPTGWFTLVAVLIAGALGHWLPAPAGPALAVVALVGLGLADLIPAVGLVMAVGAWPLLRRHPTPPVFAATAYLALHVVPWLDPVVTVLIVGAVAAVLTFGRKIAPAGQAMGAAVLGVVAFEPIAGVPDVLILVLVLVFVLASSTGWRLSAPLAVTAAFALYGTMTLAGRLTTADGPVALALVVAAAALVVAAAFTARRHAPGAGLVHRT